MGFSRQEYWSGLPFPSPGALPDPGIKPGSPALQADSLPTELWRKPNSHLVNIYSVRLPWGLGDKDGVQASQGAWSPVRLTQKQFDWATNTLRLCKYSVQQGFPGGSDGKESACSAGDLGSIFGSGRSPGEGNGKPLQYFLILVRKQDSFYS